MSYFEREARAQRAQGISIADISASLRVSETQIERALLGEHVVRVVENKIIISGELHPRPGDTGTKFKIRERWIGNSYVYDIGLTSGHRSGSLVTSIRGLTGDKIGTWLLGNVDRNES